jgi:Co/Zn/Cd efflux system component
MSQKRAVIIYMLLVGVVTFVVFGSLKRMDAAPETVSLAYILLISVAGLGVGGVMTHFRK